MKVELKLSDQRCLKLAGRRNSMSGQRGQRPSFQNGSVFARVKRREIQKHQKVRKMPHLKKQKKKKTTRRKKKKRKRKRRRNKKFLLVVLEANFISNLCNCETFHTGHCFCTRTWCRKTWSLLLYQARQEFHEIVILPVLLVTIVIRVIPVKPIRFDVKQ